MKPTQKIIDMATRRSAKSMRVQWVYWRDGSFHIVKCYKKRPGCVFVCRVFPDGEVFAA